MAEEEYHTTGAGSIHGSDGGAGDIKGRGVLDLFGKKEGEEVVMTEVETETCEKKEKPTLLEKLHRSHSSSSSSSEEEEEGEGEGGEEKKKKKKGLKDKLKEKISSEKKDQVTADKIEDTSIPIEKVEAMHEEATTEEKKGFLEKIKEKLPGGHPKKAEDSAAIESGNATVEHEGEKKGLLEKIKEKLPGHQKNGGEEKESANH